MATSSYLAAAPVVRRVRGYFAPVNRGAGVPVIFDAAEMGSFALDAPPAPWISLGWMKNFARKAGSRTAPILTGVPAAVLEQTRESVEAQVSLQFLSWTKLTMALATGSQHMNLLAPASWSSRGGRWWDGCWCGCDPEWSYGDAAAAGGCGCGEVYGGRDCGCGRGLHGADGLCGVSGFGGVCEGGSDGCGLCAAGDLQCGDGGLGGDDGARGVDAGGCAAGWGSG